MINKLQLTALLIGLLCLCVPVFWPADFEAPHWVMACAVGGLLLSFAAAFILTLIKIWA